MKKRTLIYSHGLAEEDCFFSELENLGYDLKYVVVNSNLNQGVSPIKPPGSAILHQLYDLRRGIFPREILATEPLDSVIDHDLLKFFEPHWFDLMTMCSRMDADGFSFSFEQRWSLIKSLIRGWDKVLRHLQIEKVIINHVPHFPSEHILFHLCQKMQIPVMMRVEISGSKNIYYSTSIMEKHLPMRHKMQQMSGASIDPGNQDYFDRLQQSYDDGIPWEIKQQRSFRKDQNSRLKSLTLLLKKLPRLIPKLFKNTYITMKTGKQGLSKSSNGFRYWQLLLYFYWARKKIRRNEKIYKAMVEPPDLSEKYILFSSSYQPERTTCPDAGYFADLPLIIDLLAQSIPDDWKIYYKEHPTSFLAPNNHFFFRGHMFRSQEFFETIKAHPKVKMIDVHADNYKLIDNSQAVATATGTSAWEAAIRGKVGIIFGNSWFEGCDGIYRVKNKSDMENVVEKIQSQYRADVGQLMKFRQAFLDLTADCPVERQSEMSAEEYSRAFAQFIHNSSSQLGELGLL